MFPGAVVVSPTFYTGTFFSGDPRISSEFLKFIGKGLHYIF